MEENNEQFLNYHKSSIYNIKCLTINNYIGFKSEIANLTKVKILDAGAGTGHAYSSFSMTQKQSSIFVRSLHEVVTCSVL